MRRARKEARSKFEGRHPPFAVAATAFFDGSMTIPLPCSGILMLYIEKEVHVV